MRRCRLGPLSALWRRERRSGKLMAITRKHNDTHTSSASVPHGLEDLLALNQEAAPGILGVDAPVLGEGHRAGNNLPLDVRRLGPRQEAQQILELLGP